MPRNTTESDSYERFVKGLKHYIVIELDGEWGTLECPKCETPFKVLRKEFKESKPHIGRSCPYCFRTSIKPGEEITVERMREPRD